jgi:hypothetical protein
MKVNNMEMSEDTFSKFMGFEVGLQSLIDEGVTKKEEILKMLESGLNNFDWFDLGYDMANGIRGSGWMAISDSAFEEYREMSPEEIVEDVSRWTETDNFNHEVAGLIRRHYADEDFVGIMNAIDDWVSGYVEAVNHKLEETVLEEVK